MAARRLVIVVLVMLGISTLAAVLVPGQNEDRDATTETSATGAATNTVPARPPGRQVIEAIDASDDRIEAVPLRVDDQLQLEVRSRRLDQVEIPAFGLIEAVGPDSPASFDIFATERGVFAIRLVEANRVVGRLEVRKRG